MSSVERFPAQVPANKLYTIIDGIQSSIYDANLSSCTWTTTNTTIRDLLTRSTIGAVFRDMGKTVYLPAPGGASQSTVLRKVQLVAPTGQGYYGTGGADAGSATDYFTGYVEIGGQTYGGGVGAAKIVRIN